MPGSLASPVAPDWRVGEETWTDEAEAGRVLACTCGDAGAQAASARIAAACPTVRQSLSMGCDSFPILVD